MQAPRHQVHDAFLALQHALGDDELRGHRRCALGVDQRRADVPGIRPAVGMKALAAVDGAACAGQPSTAGVS